MRPTYRVIAHLISLCVVLQATWIALGSFLLFKDVDGGKVIDKSYEGNYANGLHGIFGLMVIPLLALVLLVVSFFTKSPGASKWAGFVVLAVVVQIAVGFLAFGFPAIGALHAINAFVLLWLAELAARRAGSAPAVSAGTGTGTAEAAAV
jgi:hypothetical protein